MFNVVPRTGFERDNEGELMVSGGNFGQTNDYVELGSHTDDFAYYASVNGNRSDLGIETPVAQIIHDAQDGYGGFSYPDLQRDPEDQFRLVTLRAARQLPDPERSGRDCRRRAARSRCVRAFFLGADVQAPTLVLTSSLFYHYNRADLDGGADDFPISTTDQRSSTYVGGQETLRMARAIATISQVGISGSASTTTILQRPLQRRQQCAVRPGAETRRQPGGGVRRGHVQGRLDWLTVIAGVRQTHFAGGITENATSPRLGTDRAASRTQLDTAGFLRQVLPGAAAETLSGRCWPLRRTAISAFLPLRGERDKECQVRPDHSGEGMDASMWITSVTQATNFFDHNPIGNSNVFLPITIDGALIRALGARGALAPVLEFRSVSPRLFESDGRRDRRRSTAG